MAIRDWLIRADPGCPAIVAEGRALTYAALSQRVDAAAAALAARGVGEGDRVALALPAGADFAVTLHACWRIGAAAMPVDGRLGAAERAAQERTARLVVASPLPACDPLDPSRGVAEHDEDAVATVIHTSGTTGAPRAVELTFANWAANAEGSAVALGRDPAERWLCALPLSHVGGLSILIRSAVYGTTALIHPRFDAGAGAAALMSGEATLVSVVPTMLARLLDAGLRAPPRLRCALIGGGPLDAALAARARAADVPVAQTYGLTEACSQVTTSRIGEPGTAGRPLPGTRVVVGADGEILVRGPTVAPGAVAPDGFLHTGDLGALDDLGRLVVRARKSETIVTGGDNVAPAEVEAVLRTHPDVLDAAVFGSPDARWGERVVAAVVARPGHAPDGTAVREHAAARLAGFKVPKEVELVPELPRTASGKVRRAALR